DISAGKQIKVPQNYYPKNDPKEKPENRWRSHGHLLYGNWINSIYQSTPFQIDKIGN
ncbi:MAG: homoserine O-succinyltransferase, partial [Rhodobacterales bacterium]|nr:homoserine O-succinyltransferase [Rhodobacterales bacterium]